MLKKKMIMTKSLVRTQAVSQDRSVIRAHLQPDDGVDGRALRADETVLPGKKDRE